METKQKPTREWGGKKITFVPTKAQVPLIEDILEKLQEEDPTANVSTVIRKAVNLLVKEVLTK